MAKPFATSLIAALLAAFCLCNAPPMAWEQSNPTYTASTSSDIPHIKPFRKCSWYIPPHKRLKGYKLTCGELASASKRHNKVKPGFEAIKRSSRRIQRSTNVSKLPENKAKNRNKQLFAYDVTRSCRDLTGFYINANDVQTPLQEYMVTQGPLDSTVADFWKAVLHKHSPVVVTLVMAVENGKDKCASYWTLPQVAIDDWIVIKQHEELLATSKLIPTHKIVLRTFLAKNKNEERIIKQVHYENWPDGKIPDLDLFVKLLDSVDAIVDDPTLPITVHCSAGIGRSGTFVAAHSLRKEIRASGWQKTRKDPLLINIPKAIFLLRCQRQGLVGSSEQCKIVYQTLAKEHQPRKMPFFVL